MHPEAIGRGFLAGTGSFHDQRSATVIHGQQPGD
jgi:hypothetical protein